MPLTTARSVVHPRDAKLEKLQRHVIEASKQCGRNVLMEISPLAKWASYCRGDGLPQRRWFGHRGGNAVVGQAGLDSVAWAVGPEGGFDEEEIQLAIAAGWSPVDLGARVLRVETAAIVVPVMVGLTWKERIVCTGQ